MSVAPPAENLRNTRDARRRVDADVQVANAGFGQRAHQRDCVARHVRHLCGNRVHAVLTVELPADRKVVRQHLRGLQLRVRGDGKPVPAEVAEPDRLVHLLELLRRCMALVIIGQKGTDRPDKLLVLRRVDFQREIDCMRDMLLHVAVQHRLSHIGVADIQMRFVNDMNPFDSRHNKSSIPKTFASFYSKRAAALCSAALFELISFRLICRASRGRLQRYALRKGRTP